VNENRIGQLWPTFKHNLGRRGEKETGLDDIEGREKSKEVGQLSSEYGGELESSIES